MIDPRIPKELKDLYSKAFASWEHVGDPKLRRALENVMCALEKDITALDPSATVTERIIHSCERSTNGTENVLRRT